MKTLLHILALALLTTTGLAAPSLVWDAPPPEEQITEFRVYRRSGPATAYVYSLLATSPVPSWDLVALVPGNQTLVVTAVNVWGESEYSDPITLPVQPGKPRNVRLQITLTPP